MIKHRSSTASFAGMAVKNLLEHTPASSAAIGAASKTPPISYQFCNFAVSLQCGAHRTLQQYWGATGFRFVSKTEEL